MISKSKVLSAIVAALNEQLSASLKAANDAAQAATHAESVAETKWDTFGLESSYLAQGQQKRVLELEQSLNDYKNRLHGAAGLTTQAPCDTIVNHSLIALENLEDNQAPHCYFYLGSSGGGIKVVVEGIEVIVITTHSPIGQSLLGKGLGDEVVVKVKGHDCDFEVVQID